MPGCAITDWVGEMIRLMTAAFMAGAMLLPAIGRAQAASAAPGTEQAVRPSAPHPRATEISSQRRRASTRLRVHPNFTYPDYWPHDVYPRHDLPPNAVRVCNATYVQEYRPSGTVIVPRMSCYWRGG